MKNYALQTIMQFMRMLPDESLALVAEARYTMEPRDYMDKMILNLAAGEEERRRACQK